MRHVSEMVHLHLEAPKPGARGLPVKATPPLMSKSFILLAAGLLISAAWPLAAAPPDDNKAAPKSGVTSPYDEEEARHIAETHGFYGIGRLTLDKAGAWRGTAIQFGRIVTIEIDHQGKFSGIEKRP